MITRDYHQFKLAHALDDAHGIVSYVRAQRAPEDAKFIVGHGVIRNGLVKLLTEYGLTPKPQMGNDGVILCTIE